MLRRNIKAFLIGGVIKEDSSIGKSRIMYEGLLIQDMRDRGYVPVLDLEPQFSIKYNEAKDTYSFNLEMFGVYVGKKKAKEIEGFSGQKFYSRNTKQITNIPPNFIVNNVQKFNNSVDR